MKRRSLLAPLSDPDYEALMTETKPTAKREPNTVKLVRCPTCKQFMREGSAELGRCIDCGHPRPL